MGGGRRIGTRELQSLIREALRNNKDLQIAATRVEQARQAAAQARSGFWPWVTYDMEGGTSRGSTSAGPGGRTQFSGGGGQLGAGGFSVSDEMSDYASIVAGAVWEIDLWGRIRRMNEAARARFFASEEGRRGVIVSLVAQVAQAYFELIELDLELEIARRTQKSFDQSLHLFQQRLEGGVASRLETSRAEAAQAQAGATIPEIERQIAIKENQLCLLLGRVPGPIRPRAALSEKGLPVRVPAGIPAALIERRPDIIATEHDLRAANADIGAAIAEFFPKIGLTSSSAGSAMTCPPSHSVRGRPGRWRRPQPARFSRAGCCGRTCVRRGRAGTRRGSRTSGRCSPRLAKFRMR